MQIQKTPTSNTKLPLRTGDFDTLIAGLDYAAKGETGLNFYALSGELHRQITYRELRESAIDLAHRLVGEFPHRARIAIVSETSPEFHIFFMACQYAGLIPVPLPLPIGIGGKDGYIAQIHRMIEDCGASAVVSTSELESFAQTACDGLDGVVVGSFETFLAAPRPDAALRPFGADDVCYIQYSSGSTMAPKGIVCTQLGAVSNCGAILTHGLKCRPGDRGTSWLPLYHDMGLVGFALSPLMGQVSIDYMATTDFARRPLLWLKIISENEGTLAFSPSFGYDLCARRAHTGAADEYDISRWRVAGIGGDMVRADVLDRFSDSFRASGFKKSAFLASYGLAESTLAVTFPDLESDYYTDEIDMQKYADSGEAAPANAKTKPEHRRRFVSCGTAMPGHEVRVVDEDGQVQEDRKVGGIFIRGPSVTEGYYRADGTIQGILDKDRWHDTGDMGYTLDGDLYITGRTKELILWNGRNIWPQDIEWAVEKLPQVRDGGSAAFSVQETDGEQTVVTVVECRLKNSSEREDLVREVVATIRSTVGVNCVVVLAPPRSLIMTSSGKLSRSKVKAKFTEGAFRDDEAEHEPILMDGAMS